MNLVIRTDETLEKARSQLVFRTDLPYKKPDGSIGFRRGWVLPEDAKKLDKHKAAGGKAHEMTHIKHEADMFDDAPGDAWGHDAAAKVDDVQSAQKEVDRLSQITENMVKKNGTASGMPDEYYAALSDLQEAKKRLNAALDKKAEGRRNSDEYKKEQERAEQQRKGEFHRQERENSVTSTTHENWLRRQEKQVNDRMQGRGQGPVMAVKKDEADKSVMYVRIGNSKTLHQVTDYKEASRKYRSAIEELNTGSSETPEAAILDSNHKVIAKISYNGRVWSAEDYGKTGEGIKPLYDPRRIDYAKPVQSNEGQAPLYIEPLSDKAIIVRGDTKTHKDAIKAAGGRWNGKHGGWIFPKVKEGQVRDALGSLIGAEKKPVENNSKPVAEKPEQESSQTNKPASILDHPDMTEEDRARLKELGSKADAIIEKFNNIRYGKRSLASYGIVTSGKNGFTKKQYLDALNDEFKAIVSEVDAIKGKYLDNSSGQNTEQESAQSDGLPDPAAFNDRQYQAMIDRFYDKPDDEVYQAYEKAKETKKPENIKAIETILEDRNLPFDQPEKVTGETPDGTFKYLMKQRPYSPGAQPQEGIIGYEHKNPGPDGGWTVVEYLKPLTDEQQQNYQMIPWKNAATEPSQRHVGETKTIDGVTYQLNANHRWERVDQEQQEAAKGPKTVDDLKADYQNEQNPTTRQQLLMAHLDLKDMPDDKLQKMIDKHPDSNTARVAKDILEMRSGKASPESDGGQDNTGTQDGKSFAVRNTEANRRKFEAIKAALESGKTLYDRNSLRITPLNEPWMVKITDSGNVMMAQGKGKFVNLLTDQVNALAVQAGYKFTKEDDGTYFPGSVPDANKPTESDESPEQSNRPTVDELIERAGGKEKLKEMLLIARKAEKKAEGGAQIDITTGKPINRVSEKVVDSMAAAAGVSREEVLAAIGLKERTKTTTKGGEKKEKADTGDDMDPNSANYRFRDTGYVAGSRKEIAAQHIKDLATDGKLVTTKDVDWEEIEKNPRAARDLIVKSNLFGQVDWDALKENGMEPGAGFLIDRIYASIAKEPADGTEARKSFVYGIESIRGRLEKCKTVDDVLNTLKEIKGEIDGEVYSAKESEEYQTAYAEYKRLAEIAKSAKDTKEGLSTAWVKLQYAYNDLKYQQDKRINRGWKPDPDIADQMKQLEPGLAAAEASYKNFVAAHPELESKRRDRGDGYTSFDNDLEYAAKLAYDKVKSIQRAVVTRNLLENPVTKSWKALGDRFWNVVNYRSYRGSDAFGDHVTNAKVGRIKDWGWADKERKVTKQKVSKESVRFQLKVAENFERIGGRKLGVDSTASLKDHFGLRDVQSGNWVLRDVNSAKFHTEQSAHAFADMADILGIPDKKLSMNGRLAMAFGARGHGSSGFSGGAPKAHYEPVERVINITKMGGGGSLGHEWFHAMDNMLAETLGHSVDKNFMLTDSAKEIEGTNKPLANAFANLNKAMTTGNARSNKKFKYTDKDIRLAKYNVEKATSGLGKQIKDAGSVEKAVEEIEKRIPVPEGYSEKNRKKAEKNRNTWIAIAAAHYGKDPAGGVVSVPYGPTHSEFVAGAKELDSDRSTPYWSTGIEMAARAFQSYLEDKLAAQGRKNDYLSVYADNKYHRDPLTGTQFRPYPEGEERKRINAAFDELFKVIREGDIMQKAIDMLKPRRKGLALVIPLRR